MYPRAASVCTAACSCVVVCGCQIILAKYLGQDRGSERETFVSNQRKWRAVDLPRIFLKLVSLLDMKRPTELISSQDDSNRKRRSRRLSYFSVIRSFSK